ncbi:MAG: hypothetical protein KUG73_06535 [Pseudomonadales bacterium]|nr:hypothetical protein [Pseudomonadales bacterium]
MHSFPSVFYCGFENAAKANDIVLTLKLKSDVDLAVSWSAYKSLIYSYPAISTKYTYVESRKRYEWGFLDDKISHDFLFQEQKEQSTYQSIETVYSSYFPINESLPIRIRHIDSRTIVFLISHVFADGRTTFSWLDQWCRLYYENKPTLNKIFVNPDTVPVHWNKPGEPANKFGLAWRGMVHFAKLAAKAGLNNKEQTVDISSNKVPDPLSTDSHVASYHFTLSETENILNASKSVDLSAAAFVHRALSSALFELYPDKTRQQFGIASDVSQLFEHADDLAPGCLINPYIQQVVRDQPLVDQMRKVYDEARAGGPMSLLAMSSLIVPSHRFLENHVYNGTLVKTSKRSLFERFSFIYSHVRDQNRPHTHKVVESISGHTKSQTVFVASTIINGHLSLEMCATHMAFSPKDIDAWFNATVRSLKENIFYC